MQVVTMFFIRPGLKVVSMFGIDPGMKMLLVSWALLSVRLFGWFSCCRNKQFHYFFFLTLAHGIGSARDIIANVLYCGILVNDFELQGCYYVHFWINTLDKGENPLISQDIG